LAKTKVLDRTLDQTWPLVESLVQTRSSSVLTLVLDQSLV